METAVSLVEGYLRLNGYLTAVEFQVQLPVADRPKVAETATDIDVLAIRLPWVAQGALKSRRHAEGKPPGVALAEDQALLIHATTPDMLIGEVEEGAGRLNRGLLTRDVLYTALRRLVCCPEEHIGATTTALLAHGETVLEPPQGVACRVRLASFCGHIGKPTRPPVLTITLDHILRFIQNCLRAYAPIHRSAQFRDPVLGLLELMQKLGVVMTPGTDPSASP